MEPSLRVLHDEEALAARVRTLADFVGFGAPPAWVVGYGLDLAGALRGLPYLAVVDEVGPRRGDEAEEISAR